MSARLTQRVRLPKSELSFARSAVVWIYTRETKLTVRRAAEKAYQRAMEGTPRQAKYATRFLANSRHAEMCDKLLKVS